MKEFPSDDSLRARLEALGGRRRDRWLLAGAAAAVGLTALLLWSRSAPARIAPPSTATPAASGLAQATPGALLVHVAGAVRKPGLYELAAGARVADAIERAGATNAADLDALNLAESLTDGIKVLVPRRGEKAAAAVPPLPGSTAPQPVDVNVADQAALETIPGIGPVTAAAIIQFRTEVGPFGAIEDLLDVSGIGPATLEAIRPYVTI